MSTTGGSPRDFWLEPWEKEAIIGFHLQNPLEGYRRLTFMMLDAEVVVSPASVRRVLRQAGLLSRWKGRPSRKGTGLEQPLQPHQHWHIDVFYINLSAGFSVVSTRVASSNPVWHVKNQTAPRPKFKPQTSPKVIVQFEFTWELVFR
jgi:hypothetical protein